MTPNPRKFVTDENPLHFLAGMQYTFDPDRPNFVRDFTAFKNEGGQWEIEVWYLPAPKTTYSTKQILRAGPRLPSNWAEVIPVAPWTADFWRAVLPRWLLGWTGTALLRVVAVAVTIALFILTWRL